MAKQPAFQFYPGDWLKDTELHMCSMTTQGIWINILCRMWEQKERGKIVGTTDSFCRLLGCSKDEFQKFLSENEVQNFANVTVCNDFVTVINRRMYQEDRRRKSVYNRVLQHREKNETEKKRFCNAKVTPPSSSSSSPSGGESPPVVTNALQKPVVKNNEKRAPTILDLKDRKTALEELRRKIRAKYSFGYKSERDKHPDKWRELQTINNKINEVNRQIAGLADE